MPDLTISLTATQATKVAAAFGTPPDGVTALDHVTTQIKKWLKERAISQMQTDASNAAYDAQRVQGEADFGGF